MNSTVSAPGWQKSVFDVLREGDVKQIAYVPDASTIVVSGVSEFAASSNAFASPAGISTQVADEIAASSQECSGYGFDFVLSPHPATTTHNINQGACFIGAYSRCIFEEDPAQIFQFIVRVGVIQWHSQSVGVGERPSIGRVVCGLGRFRAR